MTPENKNWDHENEAIEYIFSSGTLENLQLPEKNSSENSSDDENEVLNDNTYDLVEIYKKMLIPKISYRGSQLVVENAIFVLISLLLMK